MHSVVNQPGQAADGDAFPRRAEIRLGGNGVLAVAEVVGNVGKEFDEHYSEVGSVPFVPPGVDDGDPVQQQLTEALVVLGQVVDVGLVGQAPPGTGSTGGSPDR